MKYGRQICTPALCSEIAKSQSAPLISEIIGIQLRSARLLFEISSTWTSMKSKDTWILKGALHGFVVSATTATDFLEWPQRGQHPQINQSIVKLFHAVSGKKKEGGLATEDELLPYFHGVFMDKPSLREGPHQRSANLTYPSHRMPCLPPDVANDRASWRLRHLISARCRRNRF